MFYKQNGLPEPLYYNLRLKQSLKAGQGQFVDKFFGKRQLKNVKINYISVLNERNFSDMLE